MSASYTIMPAAIEKDENGGIDHFYLLIWEDSVINSKNLFSSTSPWDHEKADKTSDIKFHGSLMNKWNSDGNEDGWFILPKDIFIKFLEDERENYSDDKDIHQQFTDDISKVKKYITNYVATHINGW